MRIIRAYVRNARLTHPENRHDITLGDLENRDVVLIALTPLKDEGSDEAAAIVHDLLRFRDRHGDADGDG